MTGPRERLGPGDHGGRALRMVLREVELRHADGTLREWCMPEMVHLPVVYKDIVLTWPPGGIRTEGPRYGNAEERS